MKKPEKISSYLFKYLRASLGDETSNGLNNIIVCRACREVLGKAISSYVSDVSFSNGELTIVVSSPMLKSNLIMQCTELRDKINKRIELNLVYSIRIN